MKKLYLSVLLLLPLTLIGWRTLDSPAAAAAEPAMKAHMNMLQLMRAFPFPHANVLFDTQSRDRACSVRGWRGRSMSAWASTPDRRASVRSDRTRGSSTRRSGDR